jgi:hypothetical protein
MGEALLRLRSRCHHRSASHSTRGTKRCASAQRTHSQRMPASGLRNPDRLLPLALNDALAWERLNDVDGAYFTAGDPGALKTPGALPCSSPHPGQARARPRRHHARRLGLQRM